MQVVSFALQKGGTGKTSISVSIAYELATQGRRVLLIDADPQGNATGWLVNNIAHELADALFGDISAADAITQTAAAGLFLLPTAGLDGRLRLYAETRAVSKPYAIKQLLKTLRGDFDYIVIDTSPAFGGVERQCFLASDEVIPTLQLDTFSLDGLYTFLENINQLKADYEASTPTITKIVLNAKDNRIAQQRAILEQFKARYPFAMSIIPVEQAFKRAQGKNTFAQKIDGVKTETLQALKELAGNIGGQ